MRAGINVSATFRKEEKRLEWAEWPGGGREKMSARRHLKYYLKVYSLVTDHSKGFAAVLERKRLRLGFEWGFSRNGKRVGKSDAWASSARTWQAEGKPGRAYFPGLEESM